MTGTHTATRRYVSFQNRLHTVTDTEVGTVHVPSNDKNNGNR